MSEFTNKSEKRVEQLTGYMQGLMLGVDGKKLIEKYNILDTIFIPADFLSLFDRLFEGPIEMNKLKSASNKLFNVLYKMLLEYPAVEAKKDSFIDCLLQDNKGVMEYLKDTKPLIKQINKNSDQQIIDELKDRFEVLQVFLSHYIVKENVLFPLIEKKWDNPSCLKLMWSFHDDIRQNIKLTLEVLNAERFDLVKFNALSSKVFFNVNTIIFREERVLFPVMLETFEEADFDHMLHQTAEIGLQFVKVKPPELTKEKKGQSEKLINFKTGALTLKQTELIFNHLPVDVTFVDENDTVQFFSTPKHRIFPRSTGIIGRKVQNCHPHESVDVVTRIVESFKKGEKDVASFWIHMGEKFVLIQYYAVRDEAGNYGGVLEVSQEISELQNISGDKRLLDWEN